MRVLHVITRGAGGGTQRNLDRWLAQEVAAGADVHLAVGQIAGGTPRPDGVTVHEVRSLVPQVRPLSDLRALSELRRLLSAGSFDVVHTHESKAGVLGRLAARGRVRTIIHTIHMASFGEGYPAPASAAFSRLERICASCTTFYVSVGRELAEKYVNAGIGELARFTIIRSPIQLTSFLAVRETATAQRQRIMREFDIEPGGQVIVAVGMLEARKRFDLVIRELAPLLGRGTVTLIVAGEGAERGRLEALAFDLGVGRRVRLIGHVEAVQDLLRIADAYVHASRVEGVSQSTMQAIAAGVPVVATRVEGLAELDPSPVRQVARSGAGLRTAVAQVLAGDRPAPADARLLQPWSDQQIDSDTRAFQRLVAAHVEQVR